MIPEYKFTDEDILKRYVDFYGDERIFADGLVPSLRLKLSNLSEFMREIKVNFARFYNRRHNRRGYFWGDRFKSVIVENGETLINCLAYIDLNPLRAGLPHSYKPGLDEAPESLYEIWFLQWGQIRISPPDHSFKKGSTG